MLYFVMEPLEGVLLPIASKGEDMEIIAASDLTRFSEVDYDVRSGLVSERLKLLMYRYMPKYDFKPVVYLDMPKQEQLAFWKFRPAYYGDYQADYRSDGIVSSILFPNNRAPFVFTARSPKGVRSMVVRLAVAESILRRCILGVKFTRVSEP
ncbi:MAG: hypothetical protein FWH57_04680 [Oscillospiraceae bacterium]|nr:hypothetical protein [Oscillospiraceae bacterium]